MMNNFLVSQATGGVIRSANRLDSAFDRYERQLDKCRADSLRLIQVIKECDERENRLFEEFHECVQHAIATLDRLGKRVEN